MSNMPSSSCCIHTIVCKHSSVDNLTYFQKMDDSLSLELEENYQTLSSKTRTEITLLDPFRQAYSFIIYIGVGFGLSQSQYFSFWYGQKGNTPGDSSVSLV